MDFEIRGKLGNPLDDAALSAMLFIKERRDNREAGPLNRRCHSPLSYADHSVPTREQSLCPSELRIARTIMPQWFAVHTALNSRGSHSRPTVSVDNLERPNLFRVAAIAA